MAQVRHVKASPAYLASVGHEIIFYLKDKWRKLAKIGAPTTGQACK